MATHHKDHNHALTRGDSFSVSVVVLSFFMTAVKHLAPLVVTRIVVHPLCKGIDRIKAHGPPYFTLVSKATMKMDPGR